MQYGAAYESSVKETFDRVEGAVNFSIPVFRQGLALGGSFAWDHLFRNDPTSFQYYPFNPAIGGNDPGSVAAALSAFPAGVIPTGGTYAGGSQVSWQPNYINVWHFTTNVTAALPISKGVTLGGVYNQQSFGGAYQTTAQNMNQKKTFTQGSLTYGIPNTPSSITFFFRNMRYNDYVLPSYNFNENREDVIYAIRF